MPEWDITLKVNFWAQNEEEAHEMAQAISEQIFLHDDVNEVEAPFAPTWRRDDV
jgi:hypothetical protein